MARSKVRVYTCCSLLQLCVVVIIVCLAVFVRRRQCPDEVYSSAAVAADTQRCSEIGRDALQRGGSAVDGAIAALLCTSVMNPQSMGIGGGSIFTVLDNTGKVKIINSRETAPKSIKPDLLTGCPKTFRLILGSSWMGVPGEIRGYEQAHRLYGKLPWASLFQPTIKLARDGFPVPEVQGRFLKVLDQETSPIRKFFSDENGKLLVAGDIVKFEKLADTLEIVANEGADAFYTGKIAEDLIRDIQEAGGTLTMEDLALYNVTVSDAWVVPLGDYQMHIPPPPAGGILLSLILNIMKGYALDSASLMGEPKTLTYHRYIEACKFANGLKQYIRDPNFTSGGMAKKFTEQSFADHIRSLISSDKSHSPEYYNSAPSYLDSMGTTHVSVLAEDGTAVSATSTINHIFGSRVLSPSTGVILNNQLADFCGRMDQINAGEQPPSSMAPAVLTSKSKTLVIGGSGGAMIKAGMALTLMNHLWFGKTLEDAIAAPVVFVNAHNYVMFEPKFDKAVVEALNALGHTEKNASYFFNVVNAVEKEGGCIHAVSDARKQGKAAGY